MEGLALDPSPLSRAAFHPPFMLGRKALPDREDMEPEQTGPHSLVPEQVPPPPGRPVAQLSPHSVFPWSTIDLAIPGQPERCVPAGRPTAVPTQRSAPTLPDGVSPVRAASQHSPSSDQAPTPQLSASSPHLHASLGQELREGAWRACAIFSAWPGMQRTQLNMCVCTCVYWYKLGCARL